MNVCKVEPCGRAVDDAGYCHGHYEYRRRTGIEPTHKLLTDYTLVERFLMKTRDGIEGCVLWTASTDGTGRYGAFVYEGRLQRAHRVAWQMFVGPLDDDCDLDHLCRVTLCVNPSHLDPVTHRENVLRGQSIQAHNARKTHCKRGHEFTPENTQVREGEPSHRRCRACTALRDKYRRLLGRHVTFAQIDALEAEMAVAS